MDSKKFPEDGREFNEGKLLKNLLDHFKKNTQEALNVRYLKAETLIAERRQFITKCCFIWMFITILPLFIFLFFVLVGIAIDMFKGVIFYFWPLQKTGLFSNVLDAGFLSAHEHLLIFVISLLAAYTLLAPYFLLKGVLSRQSATDSPPLVELTKDSAGLLDNGHGQ